jgi:hypothetical protein
LFTPVTVVVSVDVPPNVGLEEAVTVIAGVCKTNVEVRPLLETTV